MPFFCIPFKLYTPTDGHKTLAVKPVYNISKLVLHRFFAASLSY